MTETPAKSLTLTILPQVSVVPVPNFQYMPIVPDVVVQNPDPEPIPDVQILPARGYVIQPNGRMLQHNTTGRRRLEYQKQANRDYQKKYQDKVKKFVNIARLPLIDDRLKEVILLTHPDIYNWIDEQSLNIMVQQFVDTIHARMPVHNLTM